ncbi:MAG: hypothetical protein WC509_05500 [Candidatus Izemoplasmatales bacterium]
MKRNMILAFLVLFGAAILIACDETTTTVPSTAPTTATTTVTTTRATTTTVPTTTLSPTLPLVDGIDPAPENILGIYDLSVAEGTATIVYEKHGLPWPKMEIAITEDVDRFNKLVVTASGEGVLLVRFVGESVYEVRLNLVKGGSTYQIDLRDYDDYLATLSSIELVADPGVADSRGTIVVSKLEFDTGTAFGSVLELGDPGYNATYEWASTDEGVYTFTTEMDNSVTIGFNKVAGQEWSWAGRLYSTDETQGYNMMTVVIQGTEGTQFLVKPNDNGAMEKWINLDGTVQTVQIPLVADLFRLVCFAQPNVAPASGTVSLKSMVLSYVEPAPADVSAYETYDFEDGWVGADAGVYTIGYADGKTTVTWADRTNAWSFIKNEFALNLADHNTVTMVVKGTAGQQLIIKPNDNGAYEQTITFDGTEQTFTFTLATKPTKVLIFVDPIAGSAAGSFEIISAVTSFVSSGTNFNVGWAENDPDTYDITVEPSGLVHVDYTKIAGQEWAFMKTDFDAEDAAGKNVMLIVLRGAAGKQVLVKPNDSGALETWITFADDEPVSLWVTAESFTKVILFAEPNAAPATGSFEILKLELLYEEPDAVERDVVYDFEEGWIDNDGGIFTFTRIADATRVEWNKPVVNDWQFFKNTFTDNLANHNTITMVVQGTVGQQILIKPNDKQAFEKTVTFDGTAQTVTFTLTEAPLFVIVFADPFNHGLTGTFDILSATVSYEPQPYEITDGWAENDAGTYTIDQANEDGSVVVNYATTDTYQFMINNFDADLAYGNNTLTIVVQGTLGNTLLLKPNDSGALEQTVTFDGTEQTIVITAAAFSKLLLFAAPGTAGGQTGTFTLVSVTLTYVAGE